MKYERRKRKERSKKTLRKSRQNKRFLLRFKRKLLLSPQSKQVSKMVGYSEEEMSSRTRRRQLGIRLRQPNRPCLTQRRRTRFRLGFGRRL